MAETVTSRQFWIQAPGEGEIIRRELPPRRPDEVLVRTLFSGISRGTEALVFQGRVPESQHAAMRAPFQEGDFPGPVKYGYTSVGRVLAGPSDGSRDLEGRAVFCLFPHQDLYHVPAAAVHVLPNGLPPERAVLAGNAETAVNAVWDGGPAIGDRVVVVGGGVVGLLIAWMCRPIPGIELLLVDTDPTRAPIAERLEIPFSTESPETGDADLVFHASGTPAGLVDALAAAGDEATIVEVSWFGSRPVSLPLGEGFHSRRLTLRSSQVGRIRPSRAPRWDTDRRMRLALGLLQADELDALVSGEHPFTSLPDVLARLSREPSGALCERIRYWTEGIPSDPTPGATDV